MTIKIQPVDPVSRPFFAGEVSGIDITRPLTPDQVSAIEAGMDQYSVWCSTANGSMTQLSWPSPATSEDWKKPPATLTGGSRGGLSLGW